MVRDVGGRRTTTKFHGSYGKRGRPPKNYVPPVYGLEKKKGKFILIFN